MNDKDTLMRKFLSGETSLSEERELAGILRSFLEKGLDAEEKAALAMLEAPCAEADDSIFSRDNLEEYDRIAFRRRRPAGIIWYASAAAACIAIALMVSNRHQPAGTSGMMVEVVPESTQADPPTPVDTVSISSRQEQVKPSPSVKKRTPSRRVVQTPPARPSIIADAPTPKAPEIDYDEILAVEEELRLNMMRERLNAEIEERTKELSQTPDAYIL